MKSAPKPQRYAGGIVTPTPYKTWRARISVHGIRHEKNCKTLELARGYIDAIAINAARTDRPLTPAQYYDAQRAVAQLPEGVTILDAARAYTAASPAAIDVDTSDAIKAFLADKTAAGLRPASLSALRYATNHLPQDGAISDITSEQLGNLVAGRQPESRNNFLRMWSTFFLWCIDRGYLARNPASPITRSRREPSTPGILSPVRARAILDTTRATDPALIPYLAIALFGGVRTYELHRMDATAIRLADTCIHVAASASKIRVQRYVTILPNLAAWLAAYPPNGPLAVANHRKRLEAILRRSGGPWPPNAPRHSFASYHLALFQDAGRTAFELGHTNQTMLYQHYRNLVTSSDAKAWFAIVPEGHTGKKTGRKRSVSS
jgi:site-specific recombinase XerC